jgi:hypothetical protein
MTDENRIARAALTRLLEPRDIVGAVACSIVGVAGSGPWLVELRVLGGGLDPATDRRCRSVAGCQVASRSTVDHPLLTQAVLSHRGGDVLVQPE